MIKKKFTVGGCAQQVARCENPLSYIPLGFARLSPQAIVSATLGLEPSIVESAGVENSKKHKKSLKVDKDAAQERADAASALDNLSRLEDHPALQLDGAVCDERGILKRSYYLGLVESFKAREGAMALAGKPGFRKGEEEVPEGLRLWDDTRARSRNDAGIEDVHGAGWITDWPSKKATHIKSKWFNIKTWGSWRLAFLLAQLQRKVWERECQSTLALEDQETVSTTPLTKRRKVSKRAGFTSAEKGSSIPSAASSHADSDSKGNDLFAYFSSDKSASASAPKVRSVPRFRDIREFTKKCKI